MEELFRIFFFFLGVLLAVKLVGFLTSKSSKNPDNNRPVNPNMTAPCPPHAWRPPKPEQVGQGIVYQCDKCLQIYPRDSDPNQRNY